MISGERINLRLFRDERDVEEYVTLYNDLAERSLADHTEITPVVGRLSEFRETGFWADDRGTMLITTKDDRVVGSIGFIRNTDLELGIGYRLLRREDRGQGYMSEALRLFYAYLFETKLHITRLAILTAADNTGSRRLAVKCGYTQEGILRQAYFYRGRVCDWVVYGLLREECPPPQLGLSLNEKVG